MSSPTKKEKSSKATVKRQSTKVTQESGLEISEHNHTSSEMITNELKEVKTINEKSQSKSKKKPTDQSGGTLKTKRLVKVKRTPSSSSDSSTDSNNNHAANRQKPSQNQRTKPGPDSAVGSMIQYDAGNVSTFYFFRTHSRTAKKGPKTPKKNFKTKKPPGTT